MFRRRSIDILAQRERKMLKCISFVIVLILIATVVSLPVFASSATAPPLHREHVERRQPQATAETAQRQAWSAQATANAAWSQATAEAATATAAAQATASAYSYQTTATASAATAQAEATRRAFEAQTTQQALDLAATRDAYALSVTATAVTGLQQAESTAQAAAATRQANLANLERMNVERNQKLQPLILYGPWVLLLLAIVVIVWAAGRLIPLLESWLEEQVPERLVRFSERDDQPDVIEGFVVSRPVGEPNGEIYDLHEPSPDTIAQAAAMDNGRCHVPRPDPRGRLYLSIERNTVEREGEHR